MTTQGGSEEAFSPGRAVHYEAAAGLALLIVAFWPILTAMYGSWFDSLAYMEHGILVVPVAVCMVWSKRRRLAEIRRVPSAWGMMLVLVGAMQALLGMAAHWIWVSRTALIVSLVGWVLAFYGADLLREVSFPLAILVLMIAPPTFVFEQVTLGLQLLASCVGEAVLETLGYPVLREGNILELVGVKLSVAEACSGIRSLPAIVFVTATYEFFFVHGKLVRAVLLIMSAPAAILGNAARIVVTAVASQHDAALAGGAAHEALGYASVALSAAGCVALHQLVLFVQRARRSRRA